MSRPIANCAQNPSSQLALFGPSNHGILFYYTTYMADGGVLIANTNGECDGTCFFCLDTGTMGG